MQLRSGFCEVCTSFLIPRFTTKLISVAGIHHAQVLLSKTCAAVQETNQVETPQERGKKALRISCKRTEFNQYAGEVFGKLDNIPLASKGWHHRKSRGDHFIIHSYKDSPVSLSSDKSFSDLGVNEKLISTLERLGISSPTVIQAEAIPALFRGHNALITAETGCGKTLAYLLPMLQQMLAWRVLDRDRKLNSPLGIVVSPNRELANQIGEVAMEFTRELMLNTQVLTGGHTKKKMLNPYYDDVDLLIASFGALSKLTTTGIYSIRHVHHVVLDEADTLLDDSFNEKVHHFLRRFFFQRRIDGESPETLGTQVSLVSATIPTSLPDILGDVIQHDSLMKVSTHHVHRLLPHVTQKFYRLGRTEKPMQLLSMVKENIRRRHPTIIFSNKAATCDWISLFLGESGVECVNLNGKMLYEVRAGKLSEFQTGAVDVISCTDIGSRGINTTRVKHVINYDFPLYMADYIHRCGRTGRVGGAQDCLVSNFITSGRELELVHKIETAARKMDELPNVNGNITRTIKHKIIRNMERESR